MKQSLFDAIGGLPVMETAHQRMYLTTELLEVRQELLRQAIDAEGLSADLVKRCLKVDQAFWGKLNSESLERLQQTICNIRSRWSLRSPKVKANRTFWPCGVMEKAAVP